MVQHEHALGDKIDVLIVEDHPIVANALRLVVNGQPDMEVVGTATTAADAIRLWAEREPVVILDHTLAEGSGLEVARAPLAKQPAPNISLFTGGAEDDELAAAYELVVRAYLEKTAGPAEIIEAIRLTVAGGRASIG